MSASKGADRASGRQQNLPKYNWQMIFFKYFCRGRLSIFPTYINILGHFDDFSEVRFRTFTVTAISYIWSSDLAKRILGSTEWEFQAHSR